MNARYGIDPSYEPRAEAITLDAVDADDTYWDDRRLARSERYQADAYLYARTLLRDDRAVVVDLGCGPATKLQSILSGHAQVVGVDQPSAVRMCRELGRDGVFIEENFDAPTYAVLEHVPRVDLVIASDVIEHLLDPDRLLEYIRKIAGDETEIVLSTPDRLALHGPTNRTPANPQHVREWSAAEFCVYLRSAGFEVLLSEVRRPFSYRADRMTVRWLAQRRRLDLPHKTMHLVHCRVSV